MDTKKLVIVNVISKFQLYSVLGYITKKMDVDNYNFLFIISYHKPSKKFRIGQDDFSGKIKNVSEFRYTKTSNETYKNIKEYLKGKKFNKITLINQFSPHYMLIFKLKYMLGNKNIEQILVDEGLGMYYDSDLWKLELRMQYNQNESKAKKSIIDRIITKVKYIFKRLIINFTEKSFKNIKRHFLFKKENSSLYLNEEVANCYLEYFKSVRDENKKTETFNKKTVLIISDNLGFYLDDINEESKIYNRIITEIKKGYPDYNIIIKPHPNELKDLDKFDRMSGCEIFDNFTSVEEIINNNKIDIISGFCSTALLMSSQIFKVNTVSLIDYIDKKKLNDYGKKEYQILKH